MKKIKVLYIEDKWYYRDAFSRIVGEDERYEIIDSANMDLKSVISNSTEAEIIFLDLELVNSPTDGLDMLAELKKLDGDKNVVIVSGHFDSKYIDAAKKNKADGFIAKDEFGDVLFNILNDVYSKRWHTFLTWSSNTIIRMIEERDSKKPSRDYKAYEIEALKMYAGGFSVQEMVDEFEKESKVNIPTYHMLTGFFKEFSKDYKIRNNKATIVAKAIEFGLISPRDIDYK